MIDPGSLICDPATGAVYSLESYRAGEPAVYGLTRLSSEGDSVAYLPVVDAYFVEEVCSVVDKQAEAERMRQARLYKAQQRRNAATCAARRVTESLRAIQDAQDALRSTPGLWGHTDAPPYPRDVLDALEAARRAISYTESIAGVLERETELRFRQAETWEFPL